MKKILVYLLLVGLLAAGAAYYYVFIYKANNHRSVDNETSITITADSLVKAYITNDTVANSVYLDKAVSVTGKVIEVSNNNANQTTILMQTYEGTTGVFCTLKTLDNTILPDQTITVKGICIGFAGDVKIKDAIKL